MLNFILLIIYIALLIDQIGVRSLIPAFDAPTPGAKE